MNAIYVTSDGTGWTVVEPSEGYDYEAGRRYEVINELYEYSAKKFNEEVKK